MDTINELPYVAAVITHKVEVEHHRGASVMFHMGERIGRTTAGGIFVAARWLLNRGIAQEYDRIETYIGGKISMHGAVGTCARWSVREDVTGLHHVPFDPTLAERLRALRAA